MNGVSLTQKVSDDALTSLSVQAQGTLNFKMGATIQNNKYHKLI
jgi:hypothetical protein